MAKTPGPPSIISWQRTGTMCLRSPFITICKTDVRIFYITQTDERISGDFFRKTLSHPAYDVYPQKFTHKSGRQADIRSKVLKKSGHQFCK